MNMNRLLMAVAVLLSGALADPVDTPNLHVVAASKQFTTDFYKTISAQKSDEDILFSPFGIHTVLSMLYPGADADTKTALTNTLHVSDPQRTADDYDQILSELNDVQKVTLHIANKVYLKHIYSFQPEYGATVVEKFHTAVDNTLDFGEDPEAAAGHINSWVNETTNGKIPTLFEAGDFDSDTALVLLNAIYFKGNWDKQFSKGDTRTEPFYVNGEDNHMDVQMMHRKGTYQYKMDGELGAQVIDLPFNGDGVVMTIVLPSDINGIDVVEKNVLEQGIDKIFDGLSVQSVLVALPKFKLETKMDLGGPLKEMGLDILFDKYNCNLRKMINTGDQLYVSKAIQKTFIEVNEEGAEAAVATGVVVTVFRSARFMYYENFYVDHPFLVILRKGDNILFFGKIVKPVSGDKDVGPVSKPNRSERLSRERVFENDGSG